MEFVALQSVVLVVLPLLLEEVLKATVMYGLLETGGVDESEFVIGNAKEVGLVTLGRTPELAEVQVNRIPQVVVVLRLGVVL
jgi:hypothetical protein